MASYRFITSLVAFLVVFALTNIQHIDERAPTPQEDNHLSSWSWGKDIIFQYTNSDWKYPGTWAIFAEYCRIHGCQHVVVIGDCGFNRKMCKRLAHLGVARQSRARTLFVDNDIVPRNVKLEAFGSLCGPQPYSIGCRFDHAKKNEQHRTNSGIMCINEANTTAKSAEWLMRIDTVARCHNKSATDQYAFLKVYEGMHDAKNLHCTDETKYGARVSKEWIHYWGSEKDDIEKAISGSLQKMRTQNGTTTFLELSPGTLNIESASRVHWSDEQQQVNKESLQVLGLQLLSNGLPSQKLIEDSRDFFMATEKLTPECLIKTTVN